jgi:hypothetical protein
MPNPIANLKPGQANSLTPEQLAQLLIDIGMLEESGAWNPEYVPDQIEARLSVWGGEEIALNEEDAGLREMVFTPSGRLMVGDGTRYVDFIRRHRLLSRISGHVPGNVSLVSTVRSGNVSVTAETSAGQYGVLWWDNTITLQDSAAAATKAANTPTADWVAAPKMIRVFAVNEGASITRISGLGFAAIDASGAPLVNVAISQSLLTEFVCPAGVATLSIAESESLEFLDLSGKAPGAALASNCPNLKIVRAVGLQGESGVVNIDLQHTLSGSGQISAIAFNCLFRDLGNGNGGEIFIFGHEGTDTCDTSLATSKGWEVYTELL